MRFTWLLSELYETKQAKLGRAFLIDSLERDMASHPLVQTILGPDALDLGAVLSLIDRKPNPSLLKRASGMHHIFEGLFSVVNGISLIEMGVALNLIPWPIRQGVKNEITMVLSSDRFLLFCRDRLGNPFPARLAERLENNVSPVEQDASAEVVAAFNTLISLTSTCANNRKLKGFLTSLWFAPDTEDEPPARPSRLRQERLLGLKSTSSAVDRADGLLEFLVHLRAVKELQRDNHSTDLGPMMNNFMAPWYTLVRTHHQVLLEMAHALAMQMVSSQQPASTNMAEPLSADIERELKVLLTV